MSDFSLKLRTVPMRPESLVKLTEGKSRHKLRNKLVAIGKRVIRLTKYNINGRILHRRSSRLYHSFGYRFENIRDGFRLIIGTTKDPYIPYAKIHDTGGMAGRNHAVKIPKRRYFRLAVIQSSPFIRKQMKNYLVELIK